MILEAGGAIGVGDSPVTQSVNEVVGDAGGAELFRRSPCSAAADVDVRPVRSVIALKRRNGQVSGDGVLEILFHPCGEQGFCQRTSYFKWQWFEDGFPDWTDHDAGIDALIRPPTLAEVIRPSNRGSEDCKDLVTATRRRTGSG